MPSEPLELPEGADPQLLEPAVRRQLRTFPPDKAKAAGEHLVATGLLLDDDPQAAFAHATEAKRLAGRVGAVREALGLAAYAIGDYALAQAELRAARRLSGSPDLLPMLADCERGLGKPEKALAVANEPDAKKLDPAGRVELAMVRSGARRDLGEGAAAVLELQIPELNGNAVEEWSVRLWYAYADALLAAGRMAEAKDWFEAAAQEDDEGDTDAAERAAAIEA